MLYNWIKNGDLERASHVIEKLKGSSVLANIRGNNADGLVATFKQYNLF